MPKRCGPKWLGTPTASSSRSARQMGGARNGSMPRIRMEKRFPARCPRRSLLACQVIHSTCTRGSVMAPTCGLRGRWMLTVWLVTATRSFMPAVPMASGPTLKCAHRRSTISWWVMPSFTMRRYMCSPSPQGS